MAEMRGLFIHPAECIFAAIILVPGFVVYFILYIAKSCCNLQNMVEYFWEWTLVYAVAYVAQGIYSVVSDYSYLHPFEDYQMKATPAVSSIHLLLNSQGFHLAS